MISNQVVQNTLNDISGITDTKAAVFDRSGKLIASVDYVSTAVETQVYSFIKSDKHEAENDSCCFVRAEYDGELVFVIAAEKGNDKAELTAKLLASGLINLLRLQREKGDKDDFIKNLLLDNLLLIDIYSRSKKLHIQTDVRRVVMIVEAERGKDSNVLELLRTYFDGSNKEFVTAVDENNVIVVRELADHENNKDIEKVARAMIAYLDKENIRQIHVSYGTVVGEIKEVSRSYKEAKMALDVGKIFFSERDVIAYSELGIGRLIYQLPIPLCKLFIKEIFGGKSPDDFDEETLVTINKFFENSLNVSETSRQLFIHRNTLVYRLDKLQKSTGLDLRVFEDAITFRIALMVVKYMKYMESFEY